MPIMVVESENQLDAVQIPKKTMERIAHAHRSLVGYFFIKRFLLNSMQN